jgi:Type IV secretory system Conjugative DNA transfer
MAPTSADLTWLDVFWPSPLPASDAGELLRSLAADSSRGRVVWETRAVAGRITHSVGIQDGNQVGGLDRLIRTQVPGTLTAPGGRTSPPVGWTARLRLRGRPAQIDGTRAAPAARQLLGALAIASEGHEIATLQVVLGPGLRPRRSSLNPPDPSQSWLDVATRGQRPAPRDLARQLRDKHAEPGFTATIRVAVHAASDGRRRTILQAVLAALRTLQLPGTTIELIHERTESLHHGLLSRWAPLRLSFSETLALLGWPLEATDLPGMPAPHPRLLPLQGARPDTSRVFAQTNAPGRSLPLGIPIADALFHTVSIGPTGSGKSNALLHLIVADMKAGRSVVVIDPKSDLVRDVLERIPLGREGDVVYLDPTQPDPAGLNPVHVAGTEPELVADGILSIFRELFPSAFGPRTSDILHASLLTLAKYPDATLAWLPRLLTDSAFRARLIGSLEVDSDLAGFWSHFNGLSPAQQAQLIGPALSRLRQFLLRPSLRRVLDQPHPRFQPADIFTMSRILLVPLNTGVLGSTATRLLGSLLVSQLWQLTLARAATPPALRTPVSIYVDEAQEFLRLGHDLSDALARSRSLGVAWHLAHQYRAQMPAEMLAALDANARSKIVFGLTGKDAAVYAALASNLEAIDFASLPKFHIYASLMHGGEQRGWASGITLPPPDQTSNPAEIIAMSQVRYGREPEPRHGHATTAIPPTGARPIGPDAAIGRRVRGSR